MLAVARPAAMISSVGDGRQQSVVYMPLFENS